MSPQKLNRYRSMLTDLHERVGGEVNYVVQSIHEDVDLKANVSSAPVHLADVAAEAADASPTNSVESASPATNVRLRTVVIMSDPSTSRPRRAAASARLYGERWLRPQTSPAALTGSRRLTGRENPRREA